MDTPIPTRSDAAGRGVEVLDDPGADPALVERMLRDIARSNRFFGGRHAVRWGLRQLFDPTDRGHGFTLCDIGTGAGDLPADAIRWGAAHGIVVRAVGLERIPVAARMAQRSGLPTVLGCAGALPFADRSVDVILVSQVAHHLSRSDATRLFAACSRVARRGVVIADLRPSSFYAFAFRVGTAALGMHPMTRVDGITSLARGFSEVDLKSLVDDAGHPDARIKSLPFARITAAWRTDR